ncbi:MAG: DUF2920 family protein [Thiotrichaceae bacterium]|nr:DUF2920 family protein [Thiotrichaceae bacterium]
MLEKFTLNMPHPDIELGLPRAAIDYFVTIPHKGVKKNTGLVLFIPGFGMLANAPYVVDKLAPYLANQYNCLVVSVNYFGIHNRPETGAYYRLADDFFDLLREIYSLQASIESPTLSSTPANLPQLQNIATASLNGLGNVLPNQWINSQCQVLLKSGKGEYDSFGLLPVIDYLQVMGEVLKIYQIDTRKIIGFGSSYGGYIASLIGKLSPNTFSTIIDNSGFVKASIPHIISREYIKNSGIFYSFNGLNGYIVHEYLWTLEDEYSPYYFSDAHRAIRSLLHQAHFQKTSAQYHIFHSIQDDITATIAEKDKQVALLKKYAEVFYHRIEPQHIDGKVFKTMEHGMNASLRGLFDIVAKESRRKLFKPEYDNDFTLNKTHRFECVGRSYDFSFKDDYSLEVKITS